MFHVELVGEDGAGLLVQLLDQSGQGVLVQISHVGQITNLPQPHFNACTTMFIVYCSCAEGSGHRLIIARWAKCSSYLRVEPFAALFWALGILLANN